MTSPGMLRIGLTPAGAVSVNLTRPLVARVFIGQNPEAVVKTVPYLYTLCAHAQRAAAQAALVAAGGVPARTLDADELWLEVVHENFWRLLLDWPVVFGLAPAKAEFVRWRGERFGPQRNAATRDVLVRVLQPLIENCLAATVDRPTGLHTAGGRMLRCRQVGVPLRWPRPCYVVWLKSHGPCRLWRTGCRFRWRRPVRRAGAWGKV